MVVFGDDDMMIAIDWSASCVIKWCGLKYLCVLDLHGGSNSNNNGNELVQSSDDLNYVRWLAMRKCCKRHCLWQDESVTLGKLTHIIFSYLDEVQNMTRKAKAAYLL